MVIYLTAVAERQESGKAFDDYTNASSNGEIWSLTITSYDSCKKIGILAPVALKFLFLFNHQYILEMLKQRWYIYNGVFNFS